VVDEETGVIEFIRASFEQWGNLLIFALDKISAIQKWKKNLYHLQY